MLLYQIDRRTLCLIEIFVLRLILSLLIHDHDKPTVCSLPFEVNSTKTFPSIKSFFLLLIMVLYPTYFKPDNMLLSRVSRQFGQYGSFTMSWCNTYLAPKATADSINCVVRMIL